MHDHQLSRIDRRATTIAATLLRRVYQAHGDEQGAVDTATTTTCLSRLLPARGSTQLRPPTPTRSSSDVLKTILRGDASLASASASSQRPGKLDGDVLSSA